MFNIKLELRDLEAVIPNGCIEYISQATGVPVEQVADMIATAIKLVREKVEKESIHSAWIAALTLEIQTLERVSLSITASIPFLNWDDDFDSRPEFEQNICSNSIYQVTVSKSLKP